MAPAPIYDAVQNLFIDSYGRVLRNVHHVDQCRTDTTGRPCIIHNPTDHPMRDWPLLWRSDRRIFERICEHGIGHPDPDDMYYHVTVLGNNHEAIHGCDGCCQGSYEGLKTE